MLERQKFEDEIRKLNDSTFELFEGFPNSCPLATKKWANAFFIYAENIIPPSNTVSVAQSAAEAVLLGICSANSFNQSVIIFTNAVIEFAQQIMPGFIMTQFSGVMPTYQLNLFPIFIKAINGGSAYDFAVELSTEIDNWFKTGTAININNGLTINWE